MQILMKGSLVGPAIHLARGGKYHLSNERAQELIDAGLASAVVSVASVQPAPVSASAAHMRERASKRRRNTR